MFLAVNRDGTAAVAQAPPPAGRRAASSTCRRSRSPGPTVPGRPAGRGRAAAAGHAVRPQQAGGGGGGARVAARPSRSCGPPIVYGPRDRQVLRLFRLARAALAPLLGDGPPGALARPRARPRRGALVAAAHARRAPPAAPITRRIPRPSRSARCSRRSARRRRARVRAGALSAHSRAAALAVAGAAARSAGGPRSSIRPRRPSSWLRPGRARSAALERDAGWRAAHRRWPEGSRETARWYREAGWL